MCHVAAGGGQMETSAEFAVAKETLLFRMPVVCNGVMKLDSERVIVSQSVADWCRTAAERTEERLFLPFVLPD